MTQEISIDELSKLLAKKKSYLYGLSMLNSAAQYSEDKQEREKYFISAGHYERLSTEVYLLEIKLNDLIKKDLKQRRLI